MVNTPLIRPYFWAWYVRGGWFTSHNISFGTGLVSSIYLGELEDQGILDDLEMRNGSGLTYSNQVQIMCFFSFYK